MSNSKIDSRTLMVGTKHPAKLIPCLAATAPCDATCTMTTSGTTQHHSSIHSTKINTSITSLPTLGFENRKISKCGVIDKICRLCSFGPWPQGAKGQDTNAHRDQKETQNQVCRDLGTAPRTRPCSPLKRLFVYVVCILVCMGNLHYH